MSQGERSEDIPELHQEWFDARRPVHRPDPRNTGVEAVAARLEALQAREASAQQSPADPGPQSHRQPTEEEVWGHLWPMICLVRAFQAWAARNGLEDGSWVVVDESRTIMREWGPEFSQDGWYSGPACSAQYRVPVRHVRLSARDGLMVRHHRVLEDATPFESAGRWQPPGQSDVVVEWEAPLHSTDEHAVSMQELEERIASIVHKSGKPWP